MQCIENNGKFVCEDVEDGNLEGIFLGKTITVTVEPIGMCGLNGSMLGKYVYQELDDDY